MSFFLCIVNKMSLETNSYKIKYVTVHRYVNCNGFGQCSTLKNCPKLHTVDFHTVFSVPKIPTYEPKPKYASADNVNTERTEVTAIPAEPSFVSPPYSFASITTILATGVASIIRHTPCMTVLSIK